MLWLFIAGCPLYSQGLTIKVHTTWSGLGGRKNPIHDVAISGAKGNYRVNGKRIEDRKVEAFLRILDETDVREPSLENCGITREWLSSNYAAALESITSRKIKELSPQQVELFRSRFTDTSIVQRIFEKMFTGFHTDDYPKMTIEIRREAQEEILMESSSQHPFMLPWLGVGGYNCHLSQALAVILPENAVNRERLTAGDAFAREIADDLMDEMKQEWNQLDTDWRVGPQISLILARFSTRKPSLTCLSAIDLDGRCGWTAELTNSNLPSQWTVGAYFYRDKKDRLQGIPEFLREIDGHIATARAVPWLSAHLNQHPDTKVEIRYVEDRSLSVKALADLARDLRSHGQAELAERLLREGELCVFLVITERRGWSRWVVFPNQEMLVWDFQSDSALGFSATDLRSWERYGWSGSGALVSSEGKIVP